MEDQATSLRRLVEGKTEYNANVQPSAVQSAPPQGGWANPVPTAVPQPAPNAQQAGAQLKIRQGAARTIAITSGKGGALCTAEGCTFALYSVFPSTSLLRLVA